MVYRDSMFFAYLLSYKVISCSQPVCSLLMLTIVPFVIINLKSKLNCIVNECTFGRSCHPPSAKFTLTSLSLIVKGVEMQETL